jgi:hypothetical protein
MAGRLILGTVGTQDLYITEHPTYSHFVGIFKHHTKFAFDVREHPLLVPIFGEETTCFIPVDMGDLLTNLTLRYTLSFKASVSSTFPVNETPTGNYDDPFTPNVAIHAIEYADLFLGGFRVERLTGDWIYLHHKYHMSDYNFRDSVVPLTTAKQEPYGSDPNNEWNLRQMYVDLPFYFYNNLASSVLLCKLTKQDCYIRIKFKPLGKLVRPYLNPFTTESKITNASLLATYAYLDTNELNYLKTKPMDQLITQVQLKRHDIPRAKEEEEIQLHFQHPIKTLYFIAARKSRRFPYHDDQTLIQYMLNTKFKELGMTLNNTTLFSESFSKLVFENSLMNAAAGVNGDVSFDGPPEPFVIFQLPTRDQIASYSFALYPLDTIPSGHLNFSRIIDQRCQIKLDYSDSFSADEDPSDPENNITELQIYAKNYNILHYSSGLCGLKY